jgi:hypothetical protein
MNRKKLFVEMLNQAKEQQFGYIGTGNPEAKILIVGKECAFDPIKDSQEMEKYKKNLSLWERDKHKEVIDIPSRNWEEHYSPLYPYKGQKMKIRRKGTKADCPTSSTWYYYQKLHNRIFDENTGKINFHEKIFITELNDSPSKKTKDADTTSILKRKEFIKNSLYFKEFPVVILAGVGYYIHNDIHNDIEDIFDVEFCEEKYAGNKKSQPYWTHWNESKTKLVVNTRQLSMCVSDQLLEEIAEIIKPLVKS